MTIHKIDIRHFVLESIEATALYRPVTAATTKRSDHSFRGSHQWRDVICGVC